MIFRAILRATFLFFMGFPSLTVWSAGHALIAVGITGNESDREEFSKIAMDIQSCLVGRGFAPGDIQLLGLEKGPKCNRETILEHLDPSASLKSNDDFWLVLLGYGGTSQNNRPSFQVSGPRLTADDLAAALDKIPAFKHVFWGASCGGGVVKKLMNSRCVVLSATAEEGEISQPRFPQFWAAALKNNPEAPFETVAAAAAQSTEEFYANSPIAQGEHARLSDPATGQVLAPPFPEKKQATVAWTASNDAKPATEPSKEDSPHPDWKRMEPNEETRKLLQTAHAVPNKEGYDALMLDQQFSLTVNGDFTTSSREYSCVYLVREEAANQWANHHFSFDPGSESFTLETVRIIKPDGSSLVIDPSKALTSMATDESGMSHTSLFIPACHAGCVIELATREHVFQNSEEFSAFYREFPLQRGIPVLHSSVEVKTPKKKTFHFLLKNSDAKPVEEETEISHVKRWTFGELPALEPLPMDPCLRDLSVWLGVSSLDSWETFTNWYRRLAKGSDQVGPEVRELAKRISSASPNRLQRIKTAFERVSSLRYVAIELGVQGFRPRTPETVLQNAFGDCKDKANLLCALLREMGIPSRLALVNRMSSTDISFPGWQFNHAIAFVPKAPADGQTTDLWLDSTDVVTPFGFIAPGDLGRSALVLEEKGGVFRTVETDGAPSSIQDEWTFEETGGKWSGALHCRWTGMADYACRTEFRMLSPAQRNQALHSMLERLLPDAEFTGIQMEHLDDLTQPVELHCKITLDDTPAPSSQLDLMEVFAPPERNRPVEINDGQKLHYSQALKLVYSDGHSEPKAPPPLKLEAAGENFSILFNSPAKKTMERTATLDILKPAIPTSDYGTMRSALRTWSHRLKIPIF